MTAPIGHEAIEEMVGRAIVRLLFTTPNAGPGGIADEEVEVEPRRQLVQEPAAHHFRPQHIDKIGPLQRTQRFVADYPGLMDHTAQGVG